MAGTTERGDLVHGGGLHARRGMTLQAVEQLVNGEEENLRRRYVHALRRTAVRQAAHREGRDYALDRACSVAHRGTAAGMTFARQMARLFVAGASEAELLQLAMFPVFLVRRLIGATPRALNLIDTEEQRLDGMEDELQLRRRIRETQPRGLAAVDLVEEADLCARLAAAYQEREHALRLLADRTERGMVA